jgi:hypothetical protein
MRDHRLGGADSDRAGQFDRLQGAELLSELRRRLLQGESRAERDLCGSLLPPQYLTRGALPQIVKLGLVALAIGTVGSTPAFRREV